MAKPNNLSAILNMRNFTAQKQPDGLTAQKISSKAPPVNAPLQTTIPAAAKTPANAPLQTTIPAAVKTPANTPLQTTIPAAAKVKAATPAIIPAAAKPQAMAAATSVKNSLLQMGSKPVAATSSITPKPGLRSFLQMKKK